ncbi:uncharacterized protein [Rhodnius prolixus]
MRGLIPNEYFERVIETRLYENSKFVAAVFNLALQKMTLDLDTLHAKQAIFKEFINCACPKTGESSCPVPDLFEDGDDSVLREFINPYFATLAPNVDFGVGVRVLKLMKFSLSQVEQRHRNLATIVQCSCPNTKSCNEKIDQEIYKIISGVRDNYLSDAYWQVMFRGETGFPIIIPDEILIPLQTAWHNLLELVFGSIDFQAPGWGLFGGQLFPNLFNHTAAHYSFINDKFNTTGTLHLTGSEISSPSQVNGTASEISSGSNLFVQSSTSTGNVNATAIHTAETLQLPLVSNKFHKFLEKK